MPDPVPKVVCDAPAYCAPTPGTWGVGRIGHGVGVAALGGAAALAALQYSKGRSLGVPGNVATALGVLALTLVGSRYLQQHSRAGVP